jgi:predicted dithiol-disulfide oxidoreductase (DUF899 family)
VRLHFENFIKQKLGFGEPESAATLSGRDRAVARRVSDLQRWHAELMKLDAWRTRLAHAKREWLTPTLISELANGKEPAMAKKLPAVVSAAEWQSAHEILLAKEKAATRARDALAAERRRQPMVKIDVPYAFDGPRGKASFLDLFEGRRQLIVYHFMFAPGVDGWPDAGCPGCSFFVDQIGHLAHLRARDVSFALVSSAPREKLAAYQQRMGWSVPWYSSAGSSFNRDFRVTTDRGERFGLSVFLRDGDDIYRTYFTTSRGVEALGSTWTFLDLTPLGRQESWEDSPAGWPQSAPYAWWARHDEYPA